MSCSCKWVTIQPHHAQVSWLSVESSMNVCACVKAFTKHFGTKAYPRQMTTTNITTPLMNDVFWSLWRPCYFRFALVMWISIINVWTEECFSVHAHGILNRHQWRISRKCTLLDALCFNFSTASATAICTCDPPCIYCNVIPSLRQFLASNKTHKISGFSLLVVLSNEV